MIQNFTTGSTGTIHVVTNDNRPRHFRAVCGLDLLGLRDRMEPTPRPVTCRKCRRDVVRWLNRQGIFDR